MTTYRTITAPVLRAFILTLLLAIGAAATARAEGGEGGEKTVSATGAGVIRGCDTARALDDALADAMRKAVEQAVGAYVQSETLVDNYQLLEDKIYSKTVGYVKKYTLTKDGPPQPEINLYEVTIEAVVSDQVLKDDLASLGLLIARKNKPRTMIFIVEQNVGQERWAVSWSFWAYGSAADNPAVQQAVADKMHSGNILADQTNMGIAETTVADVFSQAGFPITDHQVKKGEIKMGKAMTIEALDDSTIQKIGSLTDAEIVIYGKALAKQQGSLRGSQMNSANANISLRAVRTDTGQTIASGSLNEAAVHIDNVTAGNEALKKASTKLAEELIGKITKAWSQEVQGAQLVNLQIKGFKSYSDFAKFKKSLSNDFREVKAVYQRQVTDTTAEVDVDLQGAAQDLADALSTHKYDGLKVTVDKLSSNQIFLTVSGK